MFPNTVKDGFVKLADAYASTLITFPHLKGITLAQWALESGWGGTGLAKMHNNFAGAKWRKYMAPYGHQVRYGAHDGEEWYVHFTDYTAFINGYWARLDLEPMYAGWRNHTATPEQFIKYIGPIWVGTDIDDKTKYVRNILRIYSGYKLDEHFKQIVETAHDEQKLADLKLDGGSTPSGHGFYKPANSAT